MNFEQLKTYVGHHNKNGILPNQVIHYFVHGSIIGTCEHRIFRYSIQEIKETAEEMKLWIPELRASIALGRYAPTEKTDELITYKGMSDDKLIYDMHITDNKVLEHMACYLLHSV